MDAGVSPEAFPERGLESPPVSLGTLGATGFRSGNPVAVGEEELNGLNRPVMVGLLFRFYIKKSKPDKVANK